MRIVFIREVADVPKEGTIVSLDDGTEVLGILEGTHYEVTVGYVVGIALHSRGRRLNRFSFDRDGFLVDVHPHRGAMPPYYTDISKNA